MKNVWAFSITMVLPAMLASVSAQAQYDGSFTQKNIPPPSSKPADYKIPVPQSSFPIQDERVAYTTPSIAWELSASSWAPRNLVADSYLPNTSKATASMPQISINLNQGLTWLGNSPYKMAAKFGLSYTSLARTGDYYEADTNVGASQDINLYTLRFGFEFSRPTNFLAGHVTPYLGIAYIPTWEIAKSSAFNDGTSDFDNALEFTGGASCGIPPVSRFLHVEQFSLELGVQATQGLGSSLSGVGIFGGTRIKI